MKFMLRYLLIAPFLVMCALRLSAQDIEPTQASIELQCNTRLSSYVHEWVEENALQLTVKNLTNHELPYSLETTILLEGKPIAKTFSYSSRKHSIAAASTQKLNTEDIFIMKEMRFFGRKQPNGVSNNLVDSGSYTVCVNIMDTTGTNYFSKSTCLHRLIIPYTAAVPLAPLGVDTLRVGKSLLFRWQGVQPFAPPQTRYILRCFPLGDSQYPAQAVRSNEPYIEKELLDSTFYLWILPDSLTQLPHRLVWTLQTKSKKGEPIGSGDGYSRLTIVPVVRELLLPKGKKEKGSKGKKR